MDENLRFSEVLNLSELRSILYFVPSPPFWRRHTDRVTKNMLTISTKPAACMSVHNHIAAIQIEGGCLKQANKVGWRRSQLTMCHEMT